MDNASYSMEVQPDRDPTELDNIVDIAGDMSNELAIALTGAALAIPNLKVTKDQTDRTLFQPIP